MAAERVVLRRRHSAELQALVLQQCAVSGASVAKVTMPHGVNANIVHGWRKLKTFVFTSIEGLLVSETTFAADPSVEETLVEEEGIWLGGERIEFVLKVSREVAGYFSRRAVLVNQTIVKELKDGGLIVLVKVGHPNEVMPQIRFWIPHIHTIAPTQ